MGLEEKDIVERIVEKRRPVLIKFMSMQDILNKHATHFDLHGNLCGYDMFGREVKLAPSYFSSLGKTVQHQSGHGFPSFAIEREWQDMFEPNMALRAIASGKYDQEGCINLAKLNVIKE